MGIEVGPPVVTGVKCSAIKSMIKDNTKGIEYLFKKIKLINVGPFLSIKTQSVLTM